MYSSWNFNFCGENCPGKVYYTKWLNHKPWIFITSRSLHVLTRWKWAARRERNIDFISSHRLRQFFHLASSLIYILSCKCKIAFLPSFHYSNDRRRFIQQMECGAIEAFSEKPPTQRRDFIREIRCDSLIAGEFDNAKLGIENDSTGRIKFKSRVLCLARRFYKVVNEGERFEVNWVVRREICKLLLEANVNSISWEKPDLKLI